MFVGLKSLMICFALSLYRLPMLPLQQQQQQQEEEVQQPSMQQ
jgi:cell division protein FtsB